MNNSNATKRLPVPVRSLPPAELKEYRGQVSRRSYERHLAKIQAKREANREAAKAYAREYRAANRELIRQNARDYNQREEVRRRRKERDQRVEARVKHRAEVLRYMAERKSRDLTYKLKCQLNTRLYCAQKRNTVKNSAVTFLGCNVEQLVAHLESQFQPGMNWDNWTFRGWHIDHKKPLAAFDLNDPEQLKIACHYTNLQPMWAVEHFRKGTKI